MTSFTNLEGALYHNEALASRTWLGVGGVADLYFEPANEADLAQFLSQLPDDMPLTIMGAGSNMLIRDGGISGAVIKLTGALADISLSGDVIIAGAGATDADVARFAARHDRSGLAFLVTIPGTIGGGLRMNAGCYGGEFKDVVRTARLMDRAGKIHELTPEEMGMAYRHSDVPADMIFLSASLITSDGDGDEIRAEMKHMLKMRAETQPQGVRTGGSTFANPDGHKAWQVISEAGCRGLRVGDASMSDKHCNFLINHGAATAYEIEQLGERVRAEVRAQSGVHLRWEIKKMGRFLPDQSPVVDEFSGDKDA